MYAVMRSYSGPGAKELFDLLEERQAEVESIMRPITGFVGYTLIKTADGGVTMTVCEDKAGTDESMQVARDWVRANAADLGAGPPEVSEGPVVLHLS